jgi:protein MpaA
MRIAALLATAAALVTASPATAARRVVLGRSVDGRAIVAYETGDTTASRRELVVGCIHGNETAGIAIARRLERAAPPGVDLWIVPVLNPDGVAAGTRGNAHGVDLNRNFPWRWRPMGGVYYSGKRPLSEPEARIAYRLIERLHPQVSIWFHQHMDLVYASGGSLAVERRFAMLSGLRLARLPALAGSAIDWQNHALRGTTSFAVELPAGSLSATAVARFARATLAVGEGR